MTRRLRSLTLCVALFTALPISRSALPAVDRGSASAALRWLPLVGAVMGAVAGVVAMAVWRGAGSGTPLLGAVLAVATLAAVTRGLHLDGLADLADGLGSRRSPAEALAVMRQSDIGPFGVLATVFAVLVQTASLAAVLAETDRPRGVVVVATAAASGRLAAVLAAGTRIPAAGAGAGGGFGALVASSVSATTGSLIGVLTVGGAVGFAAAAGLDTTGIVGIAAAVLAAQAVAAGLVQHVVRRIGGTSGDSFGAVIEVASAVTLAVLAGVVSWHGRL